MIKLKDILDISKALVCIMESIFPVIQVDTKFDASEKFSKNFSENSSAHKEPSPYLHFVILVPSFLHLVYIKTYHAKPNYSMIGSKCIFYLSKTKGIKLSRTNFIIFTGTAFPACFLI